MSAERSAGATDARRKKVLDAGQLPLRFDAVAGVTGIDQRCGCASARENEPGEAGAWRVLEPEMGDLAVVCPGCWPEMARQVGADVTVRVLGQRPEWARCGMCDPERVC